MLSSLSVSCSCLCTGSDNPDVLGIMGLAVSACFRMCLEVSTGRGCWRIKTLNLVLGVEVVCEKGLSLHVETCPSKALTKNLEDLFGMKQGARASQLSKKIHIPTMNICLWWTSSRVRHQLESKTILQSPRKVSWPPILLWRFNSFAQGTVFIIFHRSAQNISTPTSCLEQSFWHEYAMFSINSNDVMI